jgi:hypothetical protein
MFGSSGVLSQGQRLTLDKCKGISGYEGHFVRPSEWSLRNPEWQMPF